MMIWARHVSCVGEMRNLYIILVWKSYGKRPLKGDVVVDGRIVLKWILMK
jgi:hypothetical protein